MMQKLLFYILFLAVSVCISAQKQNQSYLNYIQKYHEIAQMQQREHGIPASITLAQGLLESRAGLSRLATEANNHFGIKCHGWQGEGIYEDDDAKNECFRKYKSALDSYEDHSAFLVKGKRYAFLFDYQPTDYEQWAYGLKRAGYATDPTYAYKLISIIENYALHTYDSQKSAQPKVDKTTKKPVYQKPKQVDFEEFSMGIISPFDEHTVLRNNGVRFVVALRGDTYGSIADEMGLSESKILKFNEVERGVKLQAGERVYLQGKKTKAAQGIDTYTVTDGDSMYGIAQEFGIKLKSLYDLNGISYSEGAKTGQVLKLR